LECPVYHLDGIRLRAFQKRLAGRDWVSVSGRWERLLRAAERLSHRWCPDYALGTINDPVPTPGNFAGQLKSGGFLDLFSDVVLADRLPFEPEGVAGVSCQLLAEGTLPNRMQRKYAVYVLGQLGFAETGGPLRGRSRAEGRSVPAKRRWEGQCPWTPRRSSAGFRSSPADGTSISSTVDSRIHDAWAGRSNDDMNT